MRKNGVNKQLTQMEGGVCAVNGIFANGVCCGGEKADFGLIVAKKRVPLACVFSKESIFSPSIAVNKKHLKTNGSQAQAILFYGSSVDFSKESVSLMEKTCRELERKANISRDEIIVVSTGEIGKPFTTTNFSVDTLYNGLGEDNENSLSVARVIAPSEDRAMQVAYSFYLGDTPCKIGAIFQKGIHSANSSSGIVCCLTTDIAITPALLQKALSSAVKDTLDLLFVGGACSPCDTICIMANGTANNYKIAFEDTDYDKFRYFLGQTLFQIGMQMASRYAQNGVFVCSVVGAKSKRVARNALNIIIRLPSLLRGLRLGEFSVEDIVCALHETGETIRFDDITISVQSAKGSLSLWEDGQKVILSKETVKKVCDGEDLEVLVSVGKGNYDASAISVF